MPNGIVSDSGGKISVGENQVASRHKRYNWQWLGGGSCVNKVLTSKQVTKVVKKQIKKETK
jgi:hypothetical protein